MTDNVEPLNTFEPIGDVAKRVIQKIGSVKVTPWDGKKIAKPGIYSGVPMEAYHGDLCDGPSVSSSGLRLIEAKTPLHYFATSYLNPNREPDEPKDHFSFGRAAHTLLLGEPGFHAQFAVRPEEWKDWRTKASQEWKQAQTDAGKTILIPAQLDAIRAIAQQLEAHPLVRSGILSGLVEHTIVWKDAKTGVWLKIRPDVVPMADGVVADVKTTTDASPRAVSNAILNHGYAMQGGLVTLGMKAVLGIDVTDFVLVFVEKEAPHAVSITAVDNEWLYWARRQLRRSIDTFAHCVEAGEWPGYETEATTHMPDWLRSRFENEDKSGLIPDMENAA